jgi:hypothetical protein
MSVSRNVRGKVYLLKIYARFLRPDPIIARTLRGGLIGILEPARHLLRGVFQFVVVFFAWSAFFSARSRNSEGKANFPRNFGNVNGDSPIDFDFALEEGDAASCTM